MRRVQCGFETNDLTLTNGKSEAGGWTIGTAAGAARSGSYGLRASYSGSGGGTCYVEFHYLPPVSGGRHTNVAMSGGGGGTPTPWLEVPGEANFRFDFRWTPPAASNFHTICRLLIAGTTTAVDILVARSGTDYLLQLIGATTSQAATTLTAGTWYRFELQLVRQADGNGFAVLRIYTISTNTLLHLLASKLTTNLSGSITVMRIGKVANTSNSAQDLDFDNIAINDDKGSIHTGACGAGACGTLVRPTGDQATPTTAWASTAATNYTEVDDATADDATTMVNTVTGATLHCDRYTLANYPGANAPRSVAVIIKHHEGPSAGGGADFDHNAGLWDGSADNDLELRAVGTTWTWDAHIIDVQADGSTALTSTYYNGCDLQIRKRVNTGGLNDKDVTYLALEYEDTEGLSIPDHSWSKQTQNSQVA